MKAPTDEAYGELQRAYNYFRVELFRSEVPHCLITLPQTSDRVMGYFSPSRFERKTGRETDELAMNPAHLRNRPLMEVLSTLVHEMCHVWQHHKGKPGRGRYHNRQWGTKMKEVGLQPSHTGKPGGRETGDHMTHYIVAGGQFEVQARRLIASGFKISWASDLLPVRPTRAKYTCPGCGVNVWGKPNLKITCGDCQKRFCWLSD